MLQGTRFVHFELRTTDVAAAELFYAAALGAEFCSNVSITELPKQARQLGAPAHWLGQLAALDVDAAAAALIALGAVRLGPTRSTPKAMVAVVREPGGAVVGFTTRTPGPSPVAWHQLFSEQLNASIEVYRALGWHLGERVDEGAFGAHVPFAWHAGGPSVGALTATQEREGVHPHWLFHFRVPAMGAALEAVRRHGGSVAHVATISDEQLAICEDAQGAAFALRAPSALQAK